MEKRTHADYSEAGRKRRQMNILIVEDSGTKLAKIRKCLDGVGFDAVVEKGNVADALQWLNQHKCDLLILDLQVPLRKDERPQQTGGQELLRKILRKDSNANIPAHVLGLTAHQNLQRSCRSIFESEGWVIVHYDPSKSDWEVSVQNTVSRLVHSAANEVRRKRLVLPLHGIRTFAAWHLTMADVCAEENWVCPTHRWWYGWFSLFHFLSPFSRFAKIKWFREQYSMAMREYVAICSTDQPPCVVAHSFGTFILGNALLRYRDIRVDRVVLCGSILPIQFPWDELIANGQVSEVLNEVGKEDRWPTICSFIIPGSGASGRVGFTRKHKSLLQEFHNLSHSEYFDAGQIRSRWIPFLRTKGESIKFQGAQYVERPSGDHPILTWILSPVVFVILIVVLFGLLVVTVKALNLLLDLVWSWI